MNLPNKLTVLRICMIPLFVAMFYITAIPYNYFWSAIIFVLASATDFLDGYIARKYHLVTNLGKFLDPIADKVLVSSALIVMLTVPAILPAVIGGICVAVILDLVKIGIAVYFFALVVDEHQRFFCIGGEAVFMVVNLIDQN